MKPYYQDDNVAIYHGDCLDIASQLGTFDMVLTDPPYLFKSGASGSGLSRAHKYDGALKAMIDHDFNLYSDMLINASEMLVSFCSRDQIAQYAALSTATERKFDLHVWHKIDAIPFTNNTFKSDLEYIVLLYNNYPGWKQLPQNMCSKLYQSLTIKNEPHPTVKPIPLLSRYIQIFDAQTILDPFAGSGTTGRAAKDLGRKAVLIEKEEKYCELASNRMLQEVLPLDYNDK